MDRELGILGWSQAELARRLGVRPATVTSWRHRGLPLTVARYLEAMVRLRELGEAAVAFTSRAPRAKRSVVSWERSATDRAPQQVDGDYGRRVSEWQDADLDQSEGWGEG